MTRRAENAHNEYGNFDNEQNSDQLEDGTIETE